MAEPTVEWGKQLVQRVDNLGEEFAVVKSRLDGIHDDVGKLGDRFSDVGTEIKLGLAAIRKEVAESRGEAAANDLRAQAELRKEFRELIDPIREFAASARESMAAIQKDVAESRGEALANDLRAQAELRKEFRELIDPIREFATSARTMVKLVQWGALPLLVAAVAFVFSTLQLRFVVESQEKTLAKLVDFLPRSAADSLESKARLREIDEKVSRLLNPREKANNPGGVPKADASPKADGVLKARDPRVRPVGFVSARPGGDRLREIQEAAVANQGEKASRPYHFGSQGADNVFSNHRSHSNRMVPVYAFGRKVDLGSVTGANSRYRSADRVGDIYRFLPENTVNPLAEYADQSDLYRVQKDAVDRGAKYVFTVWFDGLDWETTRAASVVKLGRVAYTEGKGTGLLFQDYSGGGTAQFGFVVTSPTHDKNVPDVDAQTVFIPGDSLRGGYDWTIAGSTPWALGPLGTKAPGYLKGSSASKDDLARVNAVGRVLHAYTDSSTSAGEYATGVKSYNNGLNVADDGRFARTLYQDLQAQGWKVGTVTSVPFDHASPAAMYAHNVYRDDYQDLGRDMLGLPSIAQEDRKEPTHPGLDVVIGTGFGKLAGAADLKKQGKNAVAGSLYLADADLASVDVVNGGRYVVVHTEAGTKGGDRLMAAALRAADGGHRLFGYFGNAEHDHLPYRTADGDYQPSKGIAGKAEVYSDDEVAANPTLADMTRAALTTLGATKKPFALFVEAGDVDWALHDNNLDNAVGAVFSGEEAIKAIIAWVEAHSNWDESALIVTSDHGHYLVVDDAEALIRPK